MRKISMYLFSVIAICLFVLGFKVDVKAATLPKITSVTLNQTEVTQSNPGTMTMHVEIDGIGLAEISYSFFLEGTNGNAADYQSVNGSIAFKDIYGSDITTTGDYTVQLPYYNCQGGKYYLNIMHLRASTELTFAGNNRYLCPDEGTSPLENEMNSSNTLTVNHDMTYTTDDERPVYGSTIQYVDNKFSQSVLDEINAMPEGYTYIIETQSPGHFVNYVPGAYTQAIKGKDKTIQFLAYQTGSSWEINGKDMTGADNDWEPGQVTLDWEGANASVCTPSGIGYYVSRHWSTDGGNPLMKCTLKFRYDEKLEGADLYLYKWSDVTDIGKNLIPVQKLKTYPGPDGQYWVEINFTQLGYVSYYVSTSDNLQLKEIRTTPTPTQGTYVPQTTDTPDTSAGPQGTVVTTTTPVVTITTTTETASTEDTVSAGEIFVSGNLCYRVTDATSVCLYNGTSAKGALVIPATVSYKGKSFNVTSIGANAFAGVKVTSVVIPDTVTVIERAAFSNARKLKTVVLGANVQVINSQAFYKCSLSTIKFTSAGVPNISKSAFSNGISGKVKVYKGQIKSSVMKKLLKQVKIKSYTMK